MIHLVGGPRHLSDICHTGGQQDLLFARPCARPRGYAETRPRQHAQILDSRYQATSTVVIWARDSPCVS